VAVAKEEAVRTVGFWKSCAAIPRDVSTRRGWRPARHTVDPVGAKLPSRRITINLDEDVVAIFKADALRGGPPYQVAINQALRAYLHERERQGQDRAVRTVLMALDEDKVIRKLRSIR
jgi:uncharacterized protein (DUF4415 family)